MASTFNSLVWKFSESISSQAITFIISIVVARLLDPSDYGVIAMVFVFTAIAQTFVDGGFCSALIQKKEADKLDFSSVLYFSLTVAVVLYVILFFSVPYIADFYGKEYSQLTAVFRVLGLKLIISAIAAVQHAYVRKKMMFKKFFWATLVGTCVSGVVGLVMAYTGYGVWALVAQHLTAAIVNLFTLFYQTRQLPDLAFSYQRLKKLLGFGVKMLGTNLLITSYKELRVLIIGKLYTASDLAYFDKGRQFPSLFVTNINSTINAVLFPKLSLEQDNIKLLKTSVRTSLRCTTYIICPLLFGLLAISEPLVRVLLTDKWIMCVPLMQLMCIVDLFQPIYTANTQALKAVGASGWVFKLELFKKAAELITLLAVMRISVMAIVINMVVMAAIFNFAFVYPNKKLLDYSLTELLSDIAPGFIMGSVMSGCVYCVNYIAVPDILKLFIQIVIGFSLYIAMSIVTKNKELKLLQSQIFKKK